jgi:hypothetical protein
MLVAERNRRHAADPALYERIDAHWCTLVLADAKRRGRVALADPSACRDGQRRSPRDGPDETSRAAGAGRPGRTTG